MLKLKLDQLLIVDIEATCWDKVPDSNLKQYQSEIIEIGVCVLDLKSDQISNKTSILVKPQDSEVSEFCTQLTTLTSEQVETGCSLAEACARLEKEFKSKTVTWASYGDYDRVHFQKECQSKLVHYPFGPRHINLKNLFAILYRLSHEVGMPEALRQLGLGLEGTHHRGHDDAWNIARIAEKILKRGNVA